MNFFFFVAKTIRVKKKKKSKRKKLAFQPFVCLSLSKDKISAITNTLVNWCLCSMSRPGKFSFAEIIFDFFLIMLLKYAKAFSL